jgi:carbonic anhydrase/acetyltransferase-like protein (isoleucine patch superfamily)
VPVSEKISYKRTITGYPLTLGKNVSVGHMSMLHGCTVGDGCLIGIKSVLLNGSMVSIRVQTCGMNAHTARPRNPEQ